MAQPSTKKQQQKHQTTVGPWLVVGTVCLLPLIITSSTVDLTMVPRFLVIALSVLLISVFFILQKDKPTVILPRTLAFPLLLFTGWIALSIIWSPVKAEALFDTLRWSLGVCYAFLAAALLRSHLLLFFKSATLIGLGLSVLSILQVGGIATMWIPPFQASPTGTMGNANLNAEILLLLCTFPIALLFTGEKIWKGISAFTILLSGITIYFTDSKSVWLGAGIAAVVFMFCVPVIYRKKYQNMGRLPFWMRKGVIPLLFFIPLIGGFLVATQTQKFHSWNAPIVEALYAESPRITSSSNSAVERVILWRQSAELMRERPFTGFGIGSWRFESGRKGIAGYYDTFGTRFYLAPHNDFFSIGAELGAPGLIFYLFLLTSIVVSAMRLLWRSRDSFTGWVMATMLFGLSAWCVISLFAFPKDRIFHLVLFFSIIALIGVLHENKAETRLPLRRFRFTALLYAVTAILSLVCGSYRFSGEWHTQRLLQKKSEKDWAGVAEEALKAKNIFYPVESGSATPIAWYEGIALFSLGDNAGGLSKLKEAKAVHPWHPHVMNNFGTALALNGDWKESEIQLAETHATYPDFSDATLNYVEVLIHNGKIALADSVFSSQSFPLETDRVKGIKDRLINQHRN